MSDVVLNSRAYGLEINKLLPEDRGVHDWYRFVLSYPPHLVRHYLTRFGASPTIRILDPFCGTGTTLVEAKKLGIPSVGSERVPLSHFVSSTKVNWTPDPIRLTEHARHIGDLTLDRLRRQGISDLPRADQNGHFSLLELSLEGQKLILDGSISPLPLHKTLTLLRTLREEGNASFQGHEELALAQALIWSIGNLHFGPEVGVGKPKPDAAVVGPWLTRVETIASDLKQVRDRTSVSSVVHLADSRNLSSVLEPNSIDAIITSPPYPNEKDYTRTTRLESVILGFVTSKQQLQDLKRELVRSNTRSVYKIDEDDLLVADHPEIQRIATAIEARRLELGKTSGFEKLYARVTKLYFGGMKRHLADLRPVLRPGASLAYVVGDQASYLRVMIRTGQILADLAGSLGYEVESIDLFRTRIATATKEQLREEVVVLRWPG